jgi:hypothetical protein
MTEATPYINSASGKEVLDRIADDWAIEPSRVHWDNDGPSGYFAFSWWPGDFCVTARANLHASSSDPAVRVRIDTEFIRGIEFSDEAVTVQTAFMAHIYTSGFALVYKPPELENFISAEAPDNIDMNCLWLSTTAYIPAETASWLPQFLGRMAILQPITAQFQADGLASVLHGEPHKSSDISEPNAPPDDVLNVLSEVIVPIGREPSRWDGSEEFAAFAEQWGRNDNCFGMGDPAGLTLEAPFGADSALIRFFTDQPHPQLGNGLLVTLQLPVIADALTMAKLANELNYMEANFWTGFPLIGSWHSRMAGDNVGIAFTTFIPNVLYQPGVATNVAFWMLHRARWVRSERYPDLVDLPMIEILRSRMI